MAEATHGLARSENTLEQRDRLASWSGRSVAHYLHVRLLNTSSENPLGHSKVGDMDQRVPHRPYISPCYRDGLKMRRTRPNQIRVYHQTWCTPGVMNLDTGFYVMRQHSCCNLQIRKHICKPIKIYVTLLPRLYKVRQGVLDRYHKLHSATPL